MVLDVVVALVMVTPFHLERNADAPAWANGNIIVSTPCGVYYEYVTWPLGADVTVGYQANPLFVIGVPFK